MKRANFPPYAVPLGTPVPVEEWLFPEGVSGYDAATDTGVQISNPEPAEQAGYLDRHLANVRCPSLFAYPASPDKRNGAAVLICPGGAIKSWPSTRKAQIWHVFSIASESALLC